MLLIYTYKVQILFDSYYNCYRCSYQDHGALVHYLIWSTSIEDFAQMMGPLLVLSFKATFHILSIQGI